MPTIKLTARGLDNLPLPSRGRVEYFDDSLPGFAVRVFPTGRRVFTLLYRLKGGRTRKKERIDLGTYPPLSLAQARELATKLKAEVQLGNDPRRNLKPDEPALLEPGSERLFRDVCLAYLDHPTGGGRLRAATTLPHYKRLLDAEVLPVFGGRVPGGITRVEIRNWSEALAAKKPVVANRSFAIMRRIFEWALSRDLVESTPFSGIHKPARETARERVLSDDEIRRVFEALTHERPIIASLWELLFFTGVRPGSALAARWEHVNLDEALWDIPITKKARGTSDGSGKPFVVPLSSQAIQTLRALIPFSAHSPFVFPGGSPRRTALSSERNLFSPQKSTDRVRERTGLRDFSMRDIRRTVATGLGRLGVAPATIARVLDHTIQGVGQVTHVYAKYDYLAEKREALEAWGRFVAKLVGQPTPSLAPAASR
jgi:integrase